MLDFEEIREWVLGFPGVKEDFPFGENSLVFKVKDKMFLLLALDETPGRFNLKSDPELSVALREEYPETVLPGYHMNKKHWNTIVLDGRLPDRQIKQLIESSYNLVGKPGKK
jgi:predicted DNA-binding protein (MmcQ/YjbR family)